MTNSVSARPRRAMLASKLANQLQSFFGFDFVIWSADQSTPTLVWGDPQSDDFAELQNEGMRFSSNGTCCLPGYVVSAVRNGHCVAAIAWNGGDNHWIVATKAPCQEPQLVERLAQVWLDQKSHDQQSKAEDKTIARLSEELARGFEELALTRCLATTCCEFDASNQISRLAEKSLPQVRRSIRAGTIAFVRKSGDESEKMTVVSRCGDETVLDDELLECVQAFGGQCIEEPFVLNHPIHGLPSIYAVALVSVRKGSELYGWLIATNTTDRSGSMHSVLLSEDELGSFETTLMESAASFFSSHAQNSELVQRLGDQVTSVVRAFVSTIEAKDRYTRGHSERVAEYARLISIEMGFDQQESAKVHFTGLLHDIGKIGVPDAILQKPGSLTDEEFEQIKAHPTIGWEILKDIEELGFAKDGILYHHEHFDGRGYPAKLSGTEIPLLGRIMAVADAFDAMTSDRSYRSSRSVTQVIAILEQGAGTQWDPNIISAFKRVLPTAIEYGNLD